MRSHAGVAAQAFKALAERQINIRAITTSEIKFSLLIDAAYTELAVRTLHSAVRAGQVGVPSLPSPTRSASRTSISGAASADIANGFYIDVGAGHPVYDNVSFAFYLAGWRGITVEPNPALAALGRAVRPRDHLYRRARAARRRARRRSICSANSTGSRPPSPSTRGPPRRRSAAAPKR